MPESTDTSLFEELKRRNVIRVGAAYLVAAWLLAQVADLILDNVESADWVMQSILIVLGIGFILAIIFAWIYELTAEGLKRENEVDRSESITHLTGRKLNFAIIGVLIMAITLLIIERLGLIGASGSAEGAPSFLLKDVAVIPFANRSAETADKYFVDGIHDDVLTQLSKIGDLTVVSRTSVERFRDTTQSIREIGDILGASAIVEGAVQRSGNRVRITVQLIESASDDHIWAETYDREITATNIFAIQSEIAIAIAKQLKAALTLEDQEKLKAIPTESFAAYDLYLRGAEIAKQWDIDAFNEAADLFRQALDIDPEYARSYAGLCDVFLQSYQYTNDTSMVPRAQSYCERALKIDDSLFEVRMSLGNLRIATGEYEQAEKYFREAIGIEPDSAWAYRRLGRSFLARELEEESEAAFLKSIALAPEDSEGHDHLADLYFGRGQFPEAIEFYEEAIRLNPDNSEHYIGLGAAKYLNGDFAGTEEAWRKSLALNANQPTLLNNMGTVFFFERRFKDALEMYLQASEQTPQAQSAWGSVGDAYRFVGGKEAESIAAYQTGIIYAEREYEVNPNNAEVVSALARFYAVTGLRKKAEEFLELALEIGSEDVYIWYERSLTLLALDRRDEALAAVEQLVAIGYSTDLLAMDAMFTEVAEDPRFRTILAEGDESP